MLPLYYSPHATSVDNEARRASGHADVPLSTPGIQQARELGQQYLAHDLDAVFCSDLQRASETARLAFSARNLPIVRDTRLRECDYGKLTRCSTDQIDKAFIRHISQPFPDGQSVLMVVERIGAFLREVLNNHAGKTVVVIDRKSVV